MKVFHKITATVRHWFADGVFRRIFKNMGLLLGGRAAMGVFSLASLSLTAHGLGVEQFGIVILVQTYVLVITGLTTFQSWQAVIRYGAISIEKGDRDSFQGLVKFTTVLDVAGVIAATLIAYFAAPYVAPYVGWSDEVVSYAQPYSLLALFSIVATPTGILRLYDRFDLLAIQSTMTPALRLVGIAVAVFTDAPLWGYLLAWFIGGVLGGLGLVWLGWREAKRRGQMEGLTLSFHNIAAPHPGIWKFCFASNLHSSLQLVTGHLATFLVGLVSTPSAAGLFKIGRDIATVLSKPAEVATQSVYPEFARLNSQGSWSDFARIIVRASAIGGGAGLVILIVVALIGKPFLAIFFGEEFRAAYGVLMMLVAAAAVTVAGFPIDPALYAMGRPGIALRVYTGAIFLVFVPLLLVWTPQFGPTGAGAASLAASIVTLIVTALVVAAQLRRRAE